MAKKTKKVAQEVQEEVKMEIIRDGKLLEETPLNRAEIVQMLFEEYPNVSLRKLAIATEATYSLLLKASKKPEPGMPYNPDAINYDEVAQYFNRRKICLSEMSWKDLNDAPSRKSASVVKDMDQFEVGKKVYLRKFPTIPYEIIYKTDSHIVIMLDGTTEPQAWAHNTFLLNGPQFTPRAVKTTDSEQVAQEGVEA